MQGNTAPLSIQAEVSGALHLLRKQGILLSGQATFCSQAGIQLSVTQVAGQYVYQEVEVR